MGVFEDNIKAFSSEKSVEAYSTLYLRSSEKYVIDKVIKRNHKVLDLGCGAGRTTKHIYDKTHNVIGVDIAKPLIKKAKELYPYIDFRVMNALDLKYSDNSFDVVFFSFNGIDNLYPKSERKRAMNEIKRVLRPNGIFAYSSHNSLAIPRTYNGLRNVLINIFRLRVGVHYRTGKSDVGRLVQYFNNVWSEQRELGKIGFKIIGVIVNEKSDRLPWPLKFIFERFPIYIAKK